MNDLLAMYRKTLEFEGNMQGTPDSCTINRALELCADAYQLGRKESDYEALRNQAAIAAMQGVMNFFGSIDYNRETIAKLAVEQADALIAELKKSDT